MTRDEIIKRSHKAIARLNDLSKLKKKVAQLARKFKAQRLLEIENSKKAMDIIKEFNLEKPNVKKTVRARNKRTTKKNAGK